MNSQTENRVPYIPNEEEERRTIIRKYRQLLTAVYNKTSVEDRKNIKKAFMFATNAHNGVRRRSGEPYIYQGEELGYWGTKANGDEYVRTPMMWTSDISSAACGDLGGRVDKSMLTASISVESQTTDESSLLNVYRRFGILRDSYSALAKGSFKEKNGIGKTAVGAWYREYDGQKILVIHNFSSATVTFEVTGDDLATMIGSNGTATANGSAL